MKNLSILALLAILLVSCAPAATPVPTSMATYTPQPTATFTPEPTATPIVSNLGGVVFFDMNGSGLRDETSFTIIFDKYGKPPLIIQTLFPKITGKSGEIFTVQEPELAGFNVCVVISGRQFCDVTDSDGKYFISDIPVASGTKVNLTITDPNAENAQLAMKLFNQRNKAVVIPEYEMNGVKIPEQNLNDTKMTLLKNGMSVSTDGESSLEIGLTMGFLSNPYLLAGAENWWVSNLFDLNPGQGILLHDGTELANMYPIRPNDKLDIGGTGDNHAGIDFEGIKGDYVVAANSGEVFYTNPHHVAIKHQYGNNIYETAYGHLDTILINNGDKVLRGQIIGINGTFDPYNPSTPTHPHIHFGLYDITNGDPAINIDPMRDIRIGLVIQDKYLVAGNPGPAVVQGSSGFMLVDNCFVFSNATINNDQ